MKGMKWTVMMGLPLVLAGCYGLEDGSIAVIFDGRHNVDIGDTESGDEWGETETSGNDTASGDGWGESDAPDLDWTRCDVSDQAVFNEMKTGDTCNFNSGCGGDFGEGMRFVQCIHGIVSVSVTVGYDDDPPRTDVLWTDCASAMADARAGERCSGYFNCTIPADYSCIEKWACNGEADRTQITHKLICNESKSFFLNDSETVEDCTNVANARPLDPCIGSFLCVDALSDGSYAIPDCSDQAGFCMDGAVSDWADFAYCDSTALHFFSNFSIQ